MTKERIDVLLTTRELAPSREKAKRLIMAGRVLANGQRVEKPGAMVDVAADLRVTGDDIPFVSRGGLKLAKALRKFSLNINGVDAMDIGASTGGFTDCMLKNGAARVLAVDVGYGQLAWSLRQDSRVTVMERTNIRKVTAADLPFVPNFVSIDVAFISLTKVLPVVKQIAVADAFIVALIKPQFEAGREYVGKHGVVRDAAVHKATIVKIGEFCRGIELTPQKLTYSPIKGPSGNIEYLLLLTNSVASGIDDMDVLATSVVTTAHKELGKDVSIGGVPQRQQE